MPIQVRIHDDLLGPLDQWIAEQPEPQPSRPDAIRRAIADWLTGMGMMPVGNKRGSKRSG